MIIGILIVKNRIMEYCINVKHRRGVEIWGHQNLLAAENVKQLLGRLF